MNLNMFEKGIFFSMLMEVRNNLNENLKYVEQFDIDPVEIKIKMEIVEKVMQDLIPREDKEMNLAEVIEYMKDK